ncbi:ABC transporter permease [Aquisalibacillus elongatus]|uniref:ABC-2 type transport system permease protein n=1 Tax=Aquisalibacillus elongatus TaxID=485577 RepID=A0A3N5BQI6_9BACI|nr:ABC transporter permease [Aquisalibacillus elongatus]RPF52028.1 ABC-2 type transport system permease protein [Aquisalibacillus elongatus]
MDTNILWKERFQNHVKMMSRYLRLMFNDHLAFALIFFVAAGAYFYQEWLSGVPDTFPVDWVLAIVLGMLLAHSPVRTFFKEADTVFLLAVENKMKPYIRNGVFYSLVIQGYWLAIFLFVFTPLYLKIYSGLDAKFLFVILGFLIGLKVINLLAVWFLEKTRDRKIQYLDVVVRFVINAIAVFMLVNQEVVFTLITIGFLLALVYLNYWNVHQKYSLPWDQLIEKEEARLQLFYRLANLSTDVPDLKRKPKKRHGLVRLVKKPIKFDQSNTYIYLYFITFIRSGDYFGMYLRLIGLTIFFIFWIPLFWGKMIFAMLFLFVTGFQFITIYNHHKTIDWVQLYPVSEQIRKKAVHQLIFLLMLIKVGMLSVLFVFATDIVGAVIYAGVGLAFTLFFENFYVKSRLNRMG